MDHREGMDLDVLIVGGGVAGLWVLDALARAGHRTLLVDRDGLGAGQSVASQGILHGGTKYSLRGLVDPSAAAIRDMPELWRRCLQGEIEPRLDRTRVLAESCCLWRTDAWRSRAGLTAATQALCVRPDALPAEQWPEPLRGCPGQVWRLPEQVISVPSLLEDLRQRWADRVVAVGDVRFQAGPEGVGSVAAVTLESPRPDEDPWVLRPRRVVLTAGAGNESLRAAIGLPAQVMQRRPLHMVLVRAAVRSLPPLFGHCVDGGATRVTVTSHPDAAGHWVWQLGGQIAERGVQQGEDELRAHARDELRAVLPGWIMNEQDLVVGSYRVDRAEARTAGWQRPESATLRREGDVVTAWPTKLVLAPVLAEQVVAALDLPPSDTESSAWRPRAFAHWPQPAVARPPWELPEHWPAGQAVGP